MPCGPDLDSNLLIKPQMLSSVHTRLNISLALLLRIHGCFPPLLSFLSVAIDSASASILLLFWVSFMPLEWSQVTCGSDKELHLFTVGKALIVSKQDSNIINFMFENSDF